MGLLTSNEGAESREVEEGAESDNVIIPTRFTHNFEANIQPKYDGSPAQDLNASQLPQSYRLIRSLALT